MRPGVDRQPAARRPDRRLVAFLPVVGGLWMLFVEALIVRVVVIAGVAAANLYLFLPRGVLGVGG